jgi:P27 family predicted phage terminase small subunit
MKGRKPKPSHLKLLAGNPGKRPIPANEPQPTKGQPPRPRHLVGEARKEWRRICGELSQLDILTMADRAALAAYCQAWATWVEAEQHLRTEGLVLKSPTGYIVENPYVGIGHKAMGQMRAFLVEFGLSPASRTRLGVAKPKDDDDTKKKEQRFFG